MNVNEFIGYMKQNASKMVKEEQVLAMVKKQLEPKDYLSIKAKRVLVDNIINECILYDNGVYKFDAIGKYVYFTMYTIAAYTNIELSEDVEDDFDALSRENLLPIIIGIIQKEYDCVNILLQMQCDSILENNSVEAFVGKFLESTMDFLNNVKSELKSGIDKISNLNEIDFANLLNMINTN